MRVINVVGARPNFMKMAPLVREMRARGVSQLLVHTGQHYDENMSRVFFEDLGIPRPDIDLEVGSGTHAEQTARVMVEFEKVCAREKPDLVVVVGDVNSTLACSVVAAKAWIPVAHVEAGLRSGDLRMPEEINRIVTDRLSEILLTHSREADRNLIGEGVGAEKIHFVGNVMIDSLIANLERAQSSTVLKTLSLAPREYGVLTLHRPSNVDDPEILSGIMGAIRAVATRLPIVFSCHPRTAECLESISDEALPGDLRMLPPLGYLDFLNLMSGARIVLTDSGGLQEETTYLGVPCLTIRENTERPITLTEGTNRLVGGDPARITEAATAVLDRPMPDAGAPELWDGKAASRMLDVFEAWWEARRATV